MDERSALHAGKQPPIDLFGVFLFTKDQSAARPAQSLVRRRGNVIGVRHGGWMQISDDRSRDVRDVGEHARSNAPGNFANALKVDDSWIRGRATDNQLRLVLFGDALQLIVINRFGFS